MAYFDENDPIRKQLAERFETTGLGPTITVDTTTGETSLGSKKNPTARDWQKAYEGYIGKGGSFLTTSSSSSATRMYQHPLFKGRGLSYYASAPYRPSFMKKMQEDIAPIEEAPAATSTPATSIRQFTDQYQDTEGGGIDKKYVDPFTAPEDHDLGYDPAMPGSGRYEGLYGEYERPTSQEPYSPAPPDPLAPMKAIGEEISQKGLFDFFGDKVDDKINQFKNNTGEFVWDTMLTAGWSAITKGHPAVTVATILGGMVDWPATQIGRWGESSHDGTSTQIAGWNSQGIGIDASGNAVLGNGMYQYKSFSHWMSHFGGTFQKDPTDPTSPASPATSITQKTSYRDPMDAPDEDYRQDPGATAAATTQHTSTSYGEMHGSEFGGDTEGGSVGGAGTGEGGMGNIGGEQGAWT